MQYESAEKYLMGSNKHVDLPNESLLHLSMIYYESKDYTKASEVIAIVNSRESNLASKLMQGLLIINGMQ